MEAKILVVMGVSGSGKSTVGELLARTLQWSYADADSFHSKENVAKMSAGQPLTDEDRSPWLQAIRAWIDERISKQEHAVVTCSALKRRYRDVLRRDEVTLVYLRGTPEQIAPRIAARKGHYFKPEMLASQFAALEEPGADENVIVVSIMSKPEEIVAEIVRSAGLDS